MRRRRESRGQRPLRKGLEIGDASVAPPLRLLLLDREEGAHLREPLRVDEFLETRPGAAHLTYYLDAVRVPIDQLVPEDAPRRGLVVPGQVVKPQQELFRSFPDVRELRGHFRAVLRDGIAALRPAIEADAIGVGAMVVSRIPVGAIQVVHPRPRAVVMAGIE